jgi:uncharacterized protein YecT (DUF1311 family)
MKYLVISILLVLGSLSSFAQASKQYRTCAEKAKTQAEMNVCASQEAAGADGELKAVSASLLSKAASDSTAVEKIKVAEGAWIAYRDAFIEATFPATDKQAEYGSKYVMEVNLLRAKLTRQHIVALKELLHHYED